MRQEKSKKQVTTINMNNQEQKNKQQRQQSKNTKHVNKSIDNVEYKSQKQQQKQSRNDDLQIKNVKMEYNWYKMLCNDIQFIQDKIQKGVLQMIDRNINDKISRLLQLAIRQKEVSREFYFHYMHIVDNILNDDHSHINLSKFVNTQYKVNYSGFIAEVLFNTQDSNQCELVVKQSIDSRIPVQSVIMKINGQPVQKYLERYIQSFGKQTNSYITNMKKQGLQLSIQNPIMYMDTIQLKDSKAVIKVKYRIAKPGYFKDSQSIFDIFHEMLMNNKLNNLHMRKLDAANLLYLDLHQFPAYSKEQQKLFESMPLILDDKYNWIILDLRSNFGGTLSILFAIIYFLYGKDLMQQISKCVQYTMATNKEINDLYYDQMILPLINNQELQKKDKQSIKQSFQKDIDNGNKQFKVFKPVQKRQKCDKNIQQEIKKRLSNDISKNKYFKKVILIVDHLCFSACLHTAKFLMQFPNVITIGHQIGKTHMSGNGLSFELPSNQGFVCVPQLFVQNTNKQNQNAITSEQNEPDIFVSDDIIYDSDLLIVKILEHKYYFDNIYKIKAKQLLSTKSNKSN